MGISFGCSASGERLVTAARDGDLQEAQALLQYNPRLAKYSTFGVRNSPLHFAAMQGHNEIVKLLLEYGVEVDIRKYCGQTALMQASRNGHWEVVLTLILYKANVNKSDYLSGQTALHLAAMNGHAQCLRILLADYLPSTPDYYELTCSSRIDNLEREEERSSLAAADNRSSLKRIVNKTADGGITPLHLAAVNGHFDCVHLLLDMSADVSAVTFQYDTVVDTIGAGSTALHWAACGGSIQCCQILISKGASLTLRNCNGWTPLQVAQAWERHWLEGLLAPISPIPTPSFPLSPYLALPLMSIMKIARECGLGNVEPQPLGIEFCAVCMEKYCTVAAEGCGHELCSKCALYLCSSMNGSTTPDPPGSISCPLCRHGIVSFVKLPYVSSIKDLVKPNLALGLCTSCSVEEPELCLSQEMLHGRTDKRSRVSPVASCSFRTVTCPGFSAMNLHCGKLNEGHNSTSSPAFACRRTLTVGQLEWQPSEIAPSDAGINSSQAVKSQERRSWIQDCWKNGQA